MTTGHGLLAALRLTRPRQWPILSAQLAVGVVLAGPEVAETPRWPVLAAAWAAWVVLLNGGTLAFNSAYDRDTGPVAYLPDPPPPPAGLAALSLTAMLAAPVVGLIGVGPVFAAVTAVCVALSVLYSHPRARWKSRPGLDLLVNMIGYGGGTTAAGVLAAGRAWGGESVSMAEAWPLVAGFALLFGAFYPTTQIYQAEEDLARGDRTLATALGTRRSLGLAVVLSLAAGWLLVRFTAAGGGPWFVPAAALGLWTGHLAWWLIRAGAMDRTGHERGMYRALGLWALVDASLVGAWLLS